MGNRLNAWILIPLILCGFALYFIPLRSNSFYLDDHSSIESNAVIQKIDIPEIFKAFNTRSLVGLSFAINYKWSALRPGGYRLVNLLVHCFNAFLVYLLVNLTLESRVGYPAWRQWPAFFASMLFLCHPIQTETVNFITQRFVLMGSFFYLLTLVLYIQYRRRSQKIYMIAGIVSSIAAMFCKEFVVTLPLMLALYEFYFIDAPAGTVWKRCRGLLPFFAVVLIVPVLLLKTPREAIHVANIASSENHIDITRANGSLSRKYYFLTEINVMRTYVRLLFWPVNQNFDYDYPVSHQFDKKTALSAVFLSCLLALAVITYRSQRLISFGILWFFIALSVESSLIPIGHVIAEYRLYLASVGFVFLVMALVYAGNLDQKTHLIAALILIFFAVSTYQRNKVWRDEFTLWNDTIQKSPHKARPYVCRGVAYVKNGDLLHALADYNKAIEIDPANADAYYNRGIVDDRLGHFGQAIGDYNRAIGLVPWDADYYNNRAATFYQLKEYDKAWGDLRKIKELGRAANAKLVDLLKNASIINHEQFYKNPLH